MALSLVLPGLSACNLVPGQVRLTVTQSEPNADPDPKFHEIDVEVRNYGSNTARNISIRDSLPTGFTYASTSDIVSTDAIRTRTLDPGVGTPSPVWGAWSLPPALGKTPTVLQVRFLAAVGRAPTRAANFVEVTSSDSDPVAARPAPLHFNPTRVLDLAVGTRSPVQAGQAAQYTVRIRNTGSAAATRVFLSVSLAPGFIYAATTGISGDSLRETGTQTDPFPDSLLPSWGTWTIPPAGFDGTPGLLTIAFTVRVVADEPPGVYPVSVTVTHDGEGAQTVDDQAPVTVLRG